MPNEVTHNVHKHRFEVETDGHLAILVYRQSGNIVTFTHTEVPDQLSGRGLGSALAQAALDDARGRHLQVVPACPFVAAYIEKHPEYKPLLQLHG